MIKAPGSCWNTTGGSNSWFKFVATTTQINLPNYSQVEQKARCNILIWHFGKVMVRHKLGCVNYTSQYSDLNLSSISLTIGNTYYISVDNHNGSSWLQRDF
jgi:hypothetical protein